MSESIKNLEDRLEYVFKDKTIPKQALTHPSIEKEPGHDGAQHYERLEFLGDRILGLVIADLLLKTYPLETEGDIAKRHTMLVQAKTLYQVAQKIDLGKCLFLSEAENRAGGRTKMTVLSDAMEAVIGGLYRDNGLETARDFIHKHWSPLMFEHETPPTDPKTELQEWAQKRSLPLPQYVLLERSGPDHAPIFEMLVRVKDLPNKHGTANTKQEAQKRAAQAMLAYIAETHIESAS